MIEDEPSVDDVLESCVRYEWDRATGRFAPVAASHGRAAKPDRWQVEASGLVQDSQILESFMSTLSANADKIYGLRVNGAKLDTASSNLLCECLWQPGKFRNLVDLDYAYIRMSFASVARMCDTISPATKGGYCSIKRLVLTRMDLGHQSVAQIFAAVQGNIFLEELILNGNNCTDAAIPALAKTLKGSQNRFRLLGIGGNDLTEESMLVLGPVLAEHPYLQELELQGNTRLGDEGSDVLFKALRDNNVLEALNLSNCGLKEIPWAGRLRIMTSLSSLNLSQNKINDAGCQVLASALESCFCLRYLDLGHNVFGGRLCRGLGEALRVNRGLLQLSLSSNPMIFEVWNAICYGLMENKTLMRLDCTWCDLTLESAEKLIEALAVNDICDVLLDLNPLPDVLRMTPRLYRRVGLPPAVHIRSDAAGIALETSQAWRKGKIQEIINSKKALTVLKNSSVGEEELPLRVSEEGDADSVGTGAAESVTASVNVSPGAKNAKVLAKHRSIADELAISGFGGKMVLTVCYGRPSEVLGTVEVTHFTTYAMAKELIRPLVQAYLASLGKLSMAASLVESFTVLDPNGLQVEGNQLNVRTVWEEACVNNYTLLLRPGNWINLPSGDNSSSIDKEADEPDELDDGSIAEERDAFEREGLDPDAHGLNVPWYVQQESRKES